MMDPNAARSDVPLVFQSNTVAPHGPRLASSNVCMWIRGLDRLKKSHLIWPMHSAIGTRRADFETVENTATRELGWMGSFHSRVGFPSM